MLDTRRLLPSPPPPPPPSPSAYFWRRQNSPSLTAVGNTPPSLFPLPGFFLVPFFSGIGGLYPASRRCRRLPPPCIRLCLSPPPSHCGRRSPFPRHPSPFPPCSMLFLCSLPSILFLICWLPPFTSVFDALAASFLPQFAPLAGLFPSLFPVLAAPLPFSF